MADTLQLEVATPERSLVHEQVSEVQIPGKNGYLGILPGHAPLLGLLGSGTLTYVVRGEKRYAAVHGGFLEVISDHVRVLADVAEHASEIDLARARAALERARQESVHAALGADPAAALAAASRAQARIATAEKR
jgi:F-type H+-transporting ATPase subunit epsilon